MKKIMIILVTIIIVVALSVAIIIFIQNPSDPCKQKVKGNGLCEAYFEGYEFDNSVGKCVKKGVSGCSFEAPFKTLEECQNVCEK
jgi:hypothetical protein